jgi:alpha-1,6-mannosyltransferase
MAFLAVALATAVLWAVWVAWVPLLPENLYLPLLDLGKITGYRWPSAILYLQLVLGLYALYAAGYWLVSRGHARLIAMFAAGAVLCLELLWVYPATAVDVFGYIAHGRVLALHNANPFIVAPLQFPSDPIIPYLAFPSEPSQYGPAWVLLGGLVAAVGGGNLLTEVLLYKGIAAAAHLGGAALVFAIARRLCADECRARASAYLYLFNPMLLWEMVGNAHNDGLMMLFGLAAAYLFVTGVDLLVLPALAAGVLVKVPVVLMAPVLFIGLWRRRVQRAVESALLAVALAAVVYKPFWEGLETLTALRRTDLFTASFGSVVRLSLAPSLGLVEATTLARWVSLGGFALVGCVALWMAVRARDSQHILQAAYVTMLGGLLLATTWFQAWYVVWPLGLGAALAEPRRHLEVALLSLGGLLQYFVFIYLWVMGFFPMSENLAVQGAAYAAIMGPLLVGLAIRSSTPHHVRIYRRA